MAPLRCPDVFGMYTYNDHAAYGIIEVIENMFLDYQEAGSWKDQWVICEGLVLFVLGPGSEYFQVEDDSRADAVSELIGRLFLTMLARLEREQLLEDQSPDIKNLGLIMTLFIKLASVMCESSLLQEDKQETVKPSKFKFTPSDFDAYILAYANKFAITLQGLADLDELLAELDTYATLPPSGQDPWGWDAALKSYSKDYSTRGKAIIGGDNLDITTWSSAERKQHSFTKKDPLTKKDLDALKSGGVLHIM
ncbi:hypothetical protein VP1G_03611 [Cytospora mali]|uniref:Uncharacterized protein n=1 Tax=Cytospora mali TaxID=578113 RepID=A0A194UX58_CYTMA|nr:hypothetical protein VP1G_03611 [Valsa mali var. pyri (nom. inval.)]